METTNTPPVNGLSVGPIMVACQWNISSPTGPDHITNSLESKYMILSLLNQLLNLSRCVLVRREDDPDSVILETQVVLYSPQNIVHIHNITHRHCMRLEDPFAGP